MRAAFCAAPGKIDVREVARPDLLPGDALVRVVGCGVCGSDLHWYLGDGPVPSVCPGHEIVGEVAAVRDGSLREGDRVAVEPLRPCGACDRCARDDYHLCRRLSILGVMEDGGFAEQLRVPVRSLYRLPDDLDSDVAVLTEPLAVAIHGTRLGGVGEQSRVLVLGSGAIGLLSIVAARSRGAAEVWATARYPHQADAARRLGAARVFDTTAEGEAELGELARQSDVDVVLETVGGTAPTFGQAMDLVGAGGRVVVLGLFDPSPLFPAMQAIIKEATVIGSMVYNRRDGVSDFERTLDVLRAEAPALRPLITDRFSLDDCQAAFDRAGDKSKGTLKVVVEP